MYTQSTATSCTRFVAPRMAQRLKIGWKLPSWWMKTCQSSWWEGLKATSTGCRREEKTALRSKSMRLPGPRSGAIR